MILSAQKSFVEPESINQKQTVSYFYLESKHCTANQSKRNLLQKNATDFRTKLNIFQQMDVRQG